MELKKVRTTGWSKTPGEPNGEMKVISKWPETRTINVELLLQPLILKFKQKINEKYAIIDAKQNQKGKKIVKAPDLLFLHKIQTRNSYYFSLSNMLMCLDKYIYF